MSTATLTSKGQTTIPKDIRDALGLQASDELNFTLLPDRTVIMRAKMKSIEDLAGSWKLPDTKRTRSPNGAPDIVKSSLHTTKSKK